MSTNRSAVEHACGRWNAGDLDGYLALYDERIRLHGYSPEPLPYEGVSAFYDDVWAAFPGSKLVFHDIMESDDKVTIRFTLTGRHDGLFMGVAPTGTEIAIPGITILRFDPEGGRVVERWSSADMLGLLVQLGAAPAPV